MMASTSSRPSTPALRRMAWIVRGLCVLGATGLLALPFAFALDPAQFQPRHLPDIRVTLDERAIVLGSLVLGAGSLLGIAALWQLWSLFGLYANGQVFERASVSRLRRFAWATLGFALAQPLLATAMVLVLTLSNPPGQRMLRLGFGSHDYMGVLVAAVLIAIATVMSDAVRLAEENESFI